MSRLYEANVVIEAVFEASVIKKILSRAVAQGGHFIEVGTLFSNPIPVVDIDVSFNLLLADNEFENYKRIYVEVANSRFFLVFRVVDGGHLNVSILDFAGLPWTQEYFLMDTYIDLARYCNFLLFCVEEFGISEVQASELGIERTFAYNHSTSPLLEVRPFVYSGDDLKISLSDILQSGPDNGVVFMDNFLKPIEVNESIVNHLYGDILAGKEPYLFVLKEKIISKILFKIDSEEFVVALMPQQLYAIHANNNHFCNAEFYFTIIFDLIKQYAINSIMAKNLDHCST